MGLETINFASTTTVFFSVLNDGILGGIVGGEIARLITTLPQHRRHDASPQRPQSLLTHNDRRGLHSIGILGSARLQGM